MTLNLHSIRPNKGARKTSRRVGRGMASSKGKTSGRGVKGQRARSGGAGGLYVRGIKQTLRRIPKVRGFKSLKAKAVVLNLRDLEGLALSVVNPTALAGKGIVSNAGTRVKILGVGEVTQAYTISGCEVSAAARTKIEAAGGTVA